MEELNEDLNGYISKVFFKIFSLPFVGMHIERYLFINIGKIKIKRNIILNIPRTEFR